MGGSAQLIKVGALKALTPAERKQLKQRVDASQSSRVKTLVKGPKAPGKKSR